MELNSACNRLYELKKICEKCEGFTNSYFNDLDDSLNSDYKKQKLISLNTLLSYLDDDSWNFLKNECCKDMCYRDDKRGWTQFFNKLNEVKGYKYLLNQGCSKVEFIPRSKKKGIETPDLIGIKGYSKILCEVKTINQSDKEIQRRINIEAKEVSFKPNNGLLSQVEKYIKKAKSQLEAFECDNISKRIIYLVINNDDWQREACLSVKRDIIEYLKKNKDEYLQIEIEVIY